MTRSLLVKMSLLVGDLCSIEVVGTEEEVGQVIKSRVEAKKEDDEVQVLKCAFKGVSY